MINRCFAHVINLANVAVIAHITKIAAVQTTSAIWDFDPTLPDNRVLSGDLDVIAAVRTLAIKVRKPFRLSDVTVLIPLCFADSSIASAH